MSAHATQPLRSSHPFQATSPLQAALAAQTTQFATEPTPPTYNYVPCNTNHIPINAVATSARIASGTEARRRRIGLRHPSRECSDLHLPHPNKKRTIPGWWPSATWSRSGTLSLRGCELSTGLWVDSLLESGKRARSRVPAQAFARGAAGSPCRSEPPVTGLRKARDGHSCTMAVDTAAVGDGRVIEGLAVVPA